MYELLTDVYKSLASWPGLQFATAIIGGYIGIKMIMRGERDRGSSNPPNASSNSEQPTWSMYGPIHEVMTAIHNMNEQSRRHIDLLERIEASLQACKSTLEMIRNESRLR